MKQPHLCASLSRGISLSESVSEKESIFKEFFFEPNAPSSYKKLSCKLKFSAVEGRFLWYTKPFFR